MVVADERSKRGFEQSLGRRGGPRCRGLSAQREDHGPEHGESSAPVAAFTAPAAVLQVRYTVVKAIRDYFDESSTSCSIRLTTNACEGPVNPLRDACVFGETAYLSQSSGFIKELAPWLLVRPTVLVPPFALRKSSTPSPDGFWMVEPEIASQITTT